MGATAAAVSARLGSLLLCVAALAIAGTVGGIVAFKGQTPAAAFTASRASGLVGNQLVTLFAAPAAGSKPATAISLVVPTHREVAITLTVRPLLHPGQVVETDRLVLLRGAYRGAIARPAGSWILEFRISSAQQPGSWFLLRLRASDRPSLVAPLLERSGATQAAFGTVPLGRYLATIDVTWDAVGRSRFEVALRGITKAPQTMRLALTMIDMNMGVTPVVLHRSGGSTYVGHSMFGMPGLWDLTLGGGRDSSSVLLYLGAAS